jgi:hypothetical protein
MVSMLMAYTAVDFTGVYLSPNSSSCIHSTWIAFYMEGRKEGRREGKG